MNEGIKNKKERKDTRYSLLSFWKKYEPQKTICKILHDRPK